MTEENNHSQFSLTPTGAHEYTTTTMSAPQLQNLTSRWLLKVLPWVQARGGIYRVNRVETNAYQQVEFVQLGPNYYQMSTNTLTALPILRGFCDKAVLKELAEKFTMTTVPESTKLPIDKTQKVIKSGEVTVEITHNKDKDVHVYGPGYHFGGGIFNDPPLESGETITITVNSKECEVLTLTQKDFEDFLNDHPRLRVHIQTYNLPPSLPPPPPPYQIMSCEYPLAVEQAVLSIPTRVADLYNDPTNQTQQQLKLVVERIREAQESRMINDPEIGLLHNVEASQRIHAIKQNGDENNTLPTPFNLDRLITNHRDPSFLLAHPRAIAAIGRRASQAGVYPESIEFGGSRVPSWRGVPLLPCTKIPITSDNYTTILVLRTGEENQGVIGLTETGLPDEYEPGLNVRFMGVDKEPGKESMISYLVSAYFSVAALIPSALGALDNVYVGEDID